MEEELTQRSGIEGVNKPPSKAPAFFVILHPSQGGGSKEEGILVANRDVSSVAPFITTGPNKSKSDFFLSANCVSGEITVTLDNNNMWNEFYRCNTEMVLTKQGRRMFPYCRYWISGLNPYLKYILVMDISPLDNHRYKWNGKWWEPAGKADPHVLGRVFIHPESPSTGQYWMHQPVSFYKLKLTNNILDQDGHIILHSMHRYLPRLHVVPAEKASDVIQLNGPDVHTFTFPQTEFIAVTAYQNFQITQLKIDCNPFAKGFREGTVTGRLAKDLKHRPSDQEGDSSSSKSNMEENEDLGSMSKLQELFRMSQYLDGDKENEASNSEQNFLSLSKLTSDFDKMSKQHEEVIKRVNEHFSKAFQPAPAEPPLVEIKQEPEDDYDYNKPVTMEGVAVKQEQSDAEAMDDHSNSDVDYPILEKHFAKFKEDPYLDGIHSSGSPVGVTKDEFLKPDPDSMPVLYPEPCAVKNLEACNLQKPVLSQDALQDKDVHNSTLCTESPSVLPSPSVNSSVEDGVCVKERRRRICKNKIDEIYATLQTALRTSRGPKRKLPSLLPKSSVTPTPGNEGAVAPIPKKRGRPPKPKLSKVGRPAKIHEAPRLFPDFNPDLEDVDGVLFVAFSSKEALEVHTGKKPTDTVSSSLSREPLIELTDEMQRILGLEQQLLTHLKTMKYRQVIHPALQQVGLKLNIVDRSMSIDLRYLGVELPLPYITSDTRYDDIGLSAQGLSFVSRTGKTTDYTKIKGWRDKFSTETASSSIKIEAGRSESSVKNLSAFCSDELDEYLENEAKLMGDLKELTQNEPESSISYQLPTKSSSYVRTLDSVLKKQAQQAMSSISGAEEFPLPRKKRKYTRRVPIHKPESKQKHVLPAPLTVKDNSTKPYFTIKKEPTTPPFMSKEISIPTSTMEYPSKPQLMVKQIKSEHSGTDQQNLVTSVQDDTLCNFQQIQLQSQQIASKSIGFSKAQIKLMDLEEGAVWEGKPRTYITKERAEVSLSTLLTAQASLKNKPILKSINKRTNSCSNEFCRLGCICSSLSSAKKMVTHCRHETCMFSSECLQNRFHIGKDTSKAKASRTPDDEAESDFSLIPGCGYKSLQAEPRVKSLDVKQTEEHQKIAVHPLHDRSIKAKKRKSSELSNWISDVQTPVNVPIWNRSDVAGDAEPLCIPEQAELLELKTLHKGHTEKVKSQGGGKPGRTSIVDPEDPVYLYFDSMMTCARVRVYSRKALEESKRKDQSICDPNIPGKEYNLKLSKAKEQEKEANKEDDERFKSIDNNSPTKLIEIISDCNWKEADNKVLNITSQHVTSREPQSIKLGSFNFELMQESKNKEKSGSSTICSRVKIAMSAEKQATLNPAKTRPVKWKVENVKPPEDEPEDNSAESKAKSLGGKGLPFYTKAIPAGKLVARLKTSDLSNTELVEVNGKNYPQAKLLLGQMGALHPANRLAAYITHRLQPSHFHLSKVNEVGGKKTTKGSSSDSTSEDKSQDILTLQQNKTAAQSRPSSMLTQFVMGEVGSMQKSPGVSSPEPTILGSPKRSTHSTRLLFVSTTVAEGKQASAIATTTTSKNMPPLSTTSLSSAGLHSVSPSKIKTPSLPTLMRVTKLVTKSSSLSIPAGIVAANDTRAITLTSLPSTKDTVLTPPPPVLTPAVVKSIATTGNTSSGSLSSNPGVNKSIATSITNLLVSSNVPQLGSVTSQVGLNIASPLTVKTVTVSSASAVNSSGGTSGPQKRLGPRLLLIPVNSASSPSRPAQCVPTSPGQKMVLQPIKSTNGVTLFRHPNGQIIQLVPLQQVHSANVQQSKQQFVIRNPGPVMGIRLPLPTKPKVSVTTSVSVPTTSIPPATAPPKLPVVSPKPSPNKSGVTVFPQNPPMLAPLGKLAVKISLPTSNSETPLPPPQVVTRSGPSVIASVMSPQSGSVSLSNVPPPTLKNVSPVIAATDPDITLMDNKPGNGRDPSKQDRKLSVPSSNLIQFDSSGGKMDKEAIKEHDGQPASEIVNDDNETKVHGSTKEQTKCVSQEDQCQKEQQDNEQSKLSVDFIDEVLTSDIDLLLEDKRKDTQSLLTRVDQGPVDNRDSQQSPAEKNANSEVKIGDSSFVTLTSACVPEQEAAVEKDRIKDKTGEKEVKLLQEQRSAKSQVFAPSGNQDNYESLQADTHIKQAFSENKEVKKDLQSEDESEVDDSVDIETVEELSDALNNSTQGKNSKGRKKVSKMNGEDMFSAEDDETHVYHRQNHTANERKRRSELRDLFEELRNALGLHSLPKVSKSYILKQAIEEVMNLTDTADTLIKKKTLLSQTQTQLIKKVSNLSGKPKEVVLKKLEYLYAKQKAVEAEKQKKNLEEDTVLHKTSINLRLPKRETFFPLNLGEDSDETQSSKAKKPIILARRPLLFSKEEKPQPGVSTKSNVLVVPTGQVVTQDPRAAGQIAGVPPTLIQASVSPAQMKSGTTSLVIQLPSTIELKSIIGNSSVPISLSTVPGKISLATPSGPVSENDDLSMMPKIVNVTSLAQGLKSNMGSELGIGTPNTERDGKNDEHSEGSPIKAPNVTSSTPVHSAYAPSTSTPLDTVEDSPTAPAKKSCIQFASPLQNVLKENDSSATEASLKSKMVDDMRDSGLELDLKKLTSAIDEAGLDPSELSMGDPEDSDETLTSLLNELAFLNQQLNKDTDDLDSVSDFAGSDTASRSSVSKYADGDLSPFSFGRFKEVPEAKEKNNSLSPFFMHLEEGEIPESVKHTEEAGSAVFEGGASKEPHVTNVVGTQSGLLQTSPTTPQKTDKPVTSCSDVFWRPMPKLAPLGLMSPTIASDQRTLANKSMPSLASVAIRLSSSKTTD